MVRLHQIVKSYMAGDQVVHALNGVSLHVREGEFVAIVGASGSGKSTMMNVIGCLDRPTSGTYYLDDSVVTELSDAELARVRNRKLGFVFQSFNLLARTSALENVELPMIYAGIPAVQRRVRAKLALERVGLASRVHHHPSALSGGQQQRVAIARALVNEPRLLLADEPTGALDSQTTEEILELFEQLHAQGVTLVIVTHEEAVAERARRRVVFKDGAIIQDRMQSAGSPC
jgi:putative ABC transport system ATP-binding protein